MSETNPKSYGYCYSLLGAKEIRRELRKTGKVARYEKIRNPALVGPRYRVWIVGKNQTEVTK
jgi:hypothetical protein